MAIIYFLVFLCECACEKESVCVLKREEVEQDSTKTECVSKTALCSCVYEYVSVFSVLEHCFIVLIYSWALCVICFKSQLGPWAGQSPAHHSQIQPIILGGTCWNWEREREGEKRKRNEGADGVVVLFFLSVYVLFVVIPQLMSFWLTPLVLYHVKYAFFSGCWFVLCKIQVVV